ncbi:hypothetical protein C2E31_06570 [Rhodopirellula baltica]|nr:hypothetical protein C2E31_06570 [Rhodopirellula baltica]
MVLSPIAQGLYSLPLCSVPRGVEIEISTSLHHKTAGCIRSLSDATDTLQTVFTKQLSDKLSRQK